MDENQENIVYDITEMEVVTDLPVDTGAADFMFDFTNFTTDGGDKPYVFYAVMTDAKREKLENKNIEVVNDKDDKMVIFNWNDLIWHFDLYGYEWRDMEREHNWLDGRIYFVREDDSEIINNDNFDEMTASFKQIDPVEELTQSQIINNAIDAIQRAYAIINAQSQS